MKAITCRRYGNPDVLALEEVDQPVPGDDEVLVKVHAASVNSWDWDNLRGTPPVIRLMMGLRSPKHLIPGADIAGRVEAVGDNVTAWSPGDEVFCDLSACGWGAFAEYVCAPVQALAPKPASTTFEEAASVPQAAVMALQGVRDYGHTQPGQHVLVNGAGGGVGTFAVQLAKLFGATVTGVDHTCKLDTMRAAGADHVVDYTSENFTANEGAYDLILDMVGNLSILDHQRALTPTGIYVMVGGSVARIPAVFMVGGWLSISGKKKLTVLAHEPNRDLAYLTQLLDEGKLTSAIHAIYALEDVPRALADLGSGTVCGKAVIRIGPSSAVSPSSAA